MRIGHPGDRLPAARGAHRRIASLVVGLAVAAAAGCGSSGGERDEDRIRGVLNAFVEAGREEDSRRACDLLAAEQIEAVEEIGDGQSCAEVLGGVLAAAGSRTTDVEIEEVRVDGERATVDATLHAEGSPPRIDTILLVKEDGEWKLASAGL